MGTALSPPRISQPITMPDEQQMHSTFLITEISLWIFKFFPTQNNYCFLHLLCRNETAGVLYACRETPSPLWAEPHMNHNLAQRFPSSCWTFAAATKNQKALLPFHAKAWQEQKKPPEREESVRFKISKSGEDSTNIISTHWTVSVTLLKNVVQPLLSLVWFI